MSANGTGQTTAASRIHELRTLLDQGVREGLGVGASLGITVDSLEAGGAVYVLDPNPATINAMFIVHGGVIATLMDTAMGSAVFTTLPDGVAYTTLELKVNFIRSVPMDGERLVCRARTVHVGRSTATVEARVEHASSGRLVAHGSSTCLLLHP